MTNESIPPGDGESAGPSIQVYTLPLKMTDGDSQLDTDGDQATARSELEGRDLNRQRSDPIEDFERACDKIQACRGELAHFSDATERENSATGTILAQRDVIASDARWGRKFNPKKTRNGQWPKWQKYIDELRIEYPHYSRNKLCDIAAAEFGVGVSTLLRVTK